MPRFDDLVSAIRKYRADNGGSRADNAIRSHSTANITIDSASDEMLARALESTARPSFDNSAQRPKRFADLNTAAIWDRYNKRRK